MIKYALIVAGGVGSRMNAGQPKQFSLLAGKPVLLHTLEAFYNADPAFHFVVVLHQSLMDEWKSMCSKYNFVPDHQLVPGGETRFHSVRNGLEHISGEGIVFIHDGVRPLVSVQTIDNCFKTALEKGNALPVISPSESVRKVEGHINSAVNRSEYVLVQTPQTFKVSLIREAYRNAYTVAFTDDASVLEHAGHPIHLVEGNRDNLKITYPEDLVMAEAVIYSSRRGVSDAKT